MHSDLRVVQRVQQLTLDALWSEAESLGSVEVDRGWGRAAGYEVKIRFERRTGTTITAVGKHTSIHCAMGDAINEAREMGAGSAA